MNVKFWSLAAVLAMGTACSDDEKPEDDEETSEPTSEPSEPATEPSEPAFVIR